MSDSIPDRIVKLRKEIDRLDSALLYILAQRFTCTDEIGILKSEYRLPALDAAREESQQKRLTKLAVDAALPEDVALEVFSTVTRIVRDRHERVRESR